MSILLVSHDLNLAAEVCDRLLLLNAGRATAIGSPETVLDDALLASVFGCEVVVDKSETTRRPIVRLTWRGNPPIAGAAPARGVRAAGRRGAEVPPAEAR
jgi:ABC-type sulfate/molybdate transport systems ATPase subunit